MFLSKRPQSSKSNSATANTATAEEEVEKFNTVQPSKDEDSDNDSDDGDEDDDNNNGFTLSDDDGDEGTDGDDDFHSALQQNSEFFLDEFGHAAQQQSSDDIDDIAGFTDQYLAYCSSRAAWNDASGEEIGLRLPGNKRGQRKKRSKSGDDESGDNEDGIITGNEYEERMRRYYVKLHPLPEWCERATARIMKIDSGAMVGESEQDREFQRILMKSDTVVDQSSHLARGLLTFHKMRDINEEMRQTKVRSIDFHPRANIALVHYANSNIALFQVDGVKNTLINVINNEGNKTNMARFSSDGKEIIQSSGHGFFFTIDLETSTVKKITVPKVSGIAQTRDSLRHFDISPNNELIAFCSTSGYIRLVSMRTKFALGEFKMNKDVNQVAFSPDSRYLFSVGRGGMVCIWDVVERKPLHIHKDEGSNNTISIAISRDFKYYATGASNGVVNIYSVDKTMEELSHDPKPMGTVSNLTTSVNLLQFNADSQMLAIGSTDKNNAVRLVHLPSFTVFSNFPAVKSNAFIEAWSFGFNRSGGFFAVASTYNVFLYRIPYYKVL